MSDPGVSIPPGSVPALLREQAHQLGDKTAVTFEGETVSYAQLAERTARVQAWLTGRGVRPGQNVALLMRNSTEFLYSWLGIAAAGAVAVPVNSAAIGESLHYTLNHSESVGLIADADLIGEIDRLGPLPSLAWRVSRGAAPDAIAPGTIELAELLATDPAGAPVHVDDADAMTIIYTSGTTGLPKGVVLSHASYRNTGRYFSKHFSLTGADVLHTCLPLFHCNAQQTTIMATLHSGATAALNGKFSVSRFWGWIRESDATLTNLLGSMLALLAKVPERADDADNPLRYVVAAPIPEALHRPMEKRYDVELVEGYGLTETGTMACINPASDERPGTIGLPLDHNELKVVDSSGDPVPDGETGELITRSRLPHAYMTGYFKEPERTAEAVIDGWFHTGDTGFRRADGYFVFVDRLKDTIRRRGENISSFLVERGLVDHPDILEAAVVGVPSELSEEDVKAIIIARPGTTMGPEEVVAWARTRMSNFMVPRYVEFRADLPRTETGRVHKYILRREGAGAAWDSERAPT